MKSTFFTLNWRDLGKAVVVAFLTAFVAAIGQALGATGGAIHWPSGAEWIDALKIAGGAAVAYLIKNLFTDDVAAAKKTLDEARKA